MRPSALIRSGLAALALVLVTASAHANLVTNGSFEANTPSGPNYKESFFGNVTGWTGGRGLTYLDAPGSADNGTYLSVYSGFPTTSPDGGNFIMADGDPNYSGAFSQTISGLTMGQSYTLSFYQAAGQQAGFTGPTTEQWNVTFGGVSRNSTLFSLAQGATGQWQQQTMTFVANAASQVLTFLAVGTPNGAPPISFLDGVDIESTPVPEPAAISLLAVGLAGIMGTLALRRRQYRV